MLVRTTQALRWGGEKEPWYEARMGQQLNLERIFQNNKRA